MNRRVQTGRRAEIVVKQIADSSGLVIAIESLQSHPSVFTFMIELDGSIKSSG